MALTKRVIVCLDVRDGMVTKGVQFKANKDIGDPLFFAKMYETQNVDELVFYDITASVENRSLMYKTMERVAQSISIPFSVGGGIRSVEDMERALESGAEKVSVNSQAVQNPELIEYCAVKFGCQCVVLGVDTKRDAMCPSGYRVFTNGGRVASNKDLLDWVVEAEQRGVGEIVLNSIDADGTKQGYDCELLKHVVASVSVPVVASGGAGKPEHIVEAFIKGGVHAALVASMVHFREYTITQIKEAMQKSGIPVRPISE